MMIKKCATALDDRCLTFFSSAVLTVLAAAGIHCCLNIYVMSKYLLKGRGSQRSRVTELYPQIRLQ